MVFTPDAPRFRLRSSQAANEGSTCMPCISKIRTRSLARSPVQRARATLSPIAPRTPESSAGAMFTASDAGGAGRRSSCTTITSPLSASSSPGSTSYRMYPWPGSTRVFICAEAPSAWTC